jgi:hypothetical protein
MKQSINHWFIRVILSVVCMGYMKSDLRAAEQCAEWAGKIVSVQGTVEARKAGDTLWIKVKLNDTHRPGDSVRVRENSRAAVALCNDAILRLDQKTTITFAAIKKEKTFLLDLLAGAVHFFSRYPRRLQVKTSFVNAAVEGTEFFVSVAPDKTILTILEGQVAAANKEGSLVLSAGTQRRPIRSGLRRASPHTKGGSSTPRCRPLGALLSADCELALGGFSKRRGNRLAGNDSRFHRLLLERRYGRRIFSAGRST